MRPRSFPVGLGFVAGFDHDGGPASRQTRLDKDTLVGPSKLGGAANQMAQDLNQSSLVHHHHWQSRRTAKGYRFRPTGQSQVSLNLVEENLNAGTLNIELRCIRLGLKTCRQFTNHPVQPVGFQIDASQEFPVYLRRQADVRLDQGAAVPLDSRKRCSQSLGGIGAVNSPPPPSSREV